MNQLVLSVEPSPIETFSFSKLRSDFAEAKIHKYIIYQNGIFYNRLYYVNIFMSKLYSQKNKNLLEKLRSARLEAGLTQVQASKKLKKPQSYLSKIERGERKIEAIELADFAKIYKKSINYFID